MIPLHDDNPIKIKPYLTWGLIISCITIFIWQLSLGQEMNKTIYSLGVVPASLFNIHPLPSEITIIPAWLTILSSMFLHGGWMHLISNILYLWIFGNNIEEAMGHKRFIIFYIVCGILAALTQATINPQSTTPMIGASGAISGVLGAYLLLYPRARVLVAIPFGLIFTTLLPAGVILILWFALQLLNNAASTGEPGGVAWGAHIGGFVAGMLLIPFFKKKNVRLFNPKRYSR